MVAQAACSVRLGPKLRISSSIPHNLRAAPLRIGNRCGSRKLELHRRITAQIYSGSLMQFVSTITCPACSHSSTERMPADACQIAYDCKSCGARLNPKVGDCCVYCSYGDVPCPPIQQAKGDCGDVVAITSPREPSQDFSRVAPSIQHERAATDCCAEKEPALFDAIVSENYTPIQHEFSKFLFAILVDEKKIFGNDLDTLLVYTAISRYYLRDERAGLDPEDDAFGGLALTKIAETTKIPRETVRRKLQLLESIGLLERSSRNEWRVAVKDGQPVIRTEFADVWQQEMWRILKFVRALKGYV
jgi:hypothetical protein